VFRTIGVAVLSVAALVLWNDAASFDRALGQGTKPADLADAARASSGEVLWATGSTESWFWLGRPNWAAKIQGAGIVFSRDLAMRYAERARFLVDHGFDAGEMLGRTSSSITLPRPDAGAFAALCARPDAPVSVVLPLAVGASAPDAWRAHTVWHAPVPRVETQLDATGTPLRTQDYAVVLCADHR
jgi:hypothetical protein